MISNQILQNTIDGTKDITDKDYAVLDTDGIVLATTTNSADDYVKATRRGTRALDRMSQLIIFSRKWFLHED